MSKAGYVILAQSIAATQQRRNWDRVLWCAVTAVSLSFSVAAMAYCYM